MINIGVTGHQRLNGGSDSWRWVKNILCKELDEIHVPITGISSLAVGADQLFASIVLDHGGRIYVVIPFAGYDRTFSQTNLYKYNRMISQASTVELLQTMETEEDAYLAAGKRIVDLADLMFAIWNGKPAMGKGGTAAVVSDAIERKTRLLHINPTDRTVTLK
jgi:hypothetical protein